MNMIQQFMDVYKYSIMYYQKNIKYPLNFSTFLHWGGVRAFEQA